MTTIYIGPYLVIPPAPISRLESVKKCANNCKTLAAGSLAKFCESCGSPIRTEEVAVEQVRPLPIQRLDDVWTDFMFCPEYGQRHPAGDIWLPNMGKHGMTYTPGQEDSYLPVRLADINGDEMLRRAQAQYADFVTALTADFGIAPFWEVGVIAYAH